MLVLSPSQPAAANLPRLARPAHHFWRTNLADAAQPVPAARRFIRKHLTACGLDFEDTELLASELVTNAEVHGGGATWLALALTGGRLVLRVSDRKPEALPNFAIAQSLEAEGGRGLLLATALAQCLRVEQRRRGTKRVVAELALVPIAAGSR